MTAEHAKRYRERHPDRVLATKRNWRKNRPEVAKAADKRNTAHKQKVREEKRTALLREQGFVCKACGTDDPGSKHGWHKDHCHVTGVVRGILCHGCNVALGQVKDDPYRLLLLIKYLGGLS